MLWAPLPLCNQLPGWSRRVMSEIWEELASVEQLQEGPESGMNLPLGATSVPHCSMRAWRKTQAAPRGNCLSQLPSIKHLFPQQSAGGSWGLRTNGSTWDLQFHVSYLCLSVRGQTDSCFPLTQTAFVPFLWEPEPVRLSTLWNIWLFPMKPHEGEHRSYRQIPEDKGCKELKGGHLRTWLASRASRGELKWAAIVSYFDTVAL